MEAYYFFGRDHQLLQVRWRCTIQTVRQYDLKLEYNLSITITPNHCYEKVETLPYIFPLIILGQ